MDTAPEDGPATGAAPALPQHPREGPEQWIIPPISDNALSRPHLTGLLDEATHARLTVVSAGPGWGKTTTVARWAAGRSTTEGRPPVAWLTATPRTNSPEAFWKGVLVALQGCDAIPSDHPIATLTASAGVTDGFLRTIQRGLGSLPSAPLLIIDDFHHLTDQRVLDSVATILAEAWNLRLLLVTRSVPALPLHQLRLSGELIEVTSAELAFRPREVAALARLAGLSLSAGQVERVIDQTTGWPTGVRLVLMRATREGATPTATFGGAAPSIAEYLSTEVLESTDPTTRHFLLRISVTATVCAELAAAIVPDAPGQQILEDLERRNLFVINVSADRVWFRVHPLLRDLLLHVLAENEPEAFRDAHRRAAVWWSAHGDPLQGLAQAADANDWELFGHIFVTAAGPSIVGVDAEAIEALLRLVPYGSLPETATTHLEQASLALLTEDLGAIGGHVARAAELNLLQPQPDPAVGVLVVMFSGVGDRLSGEYAQLASRARAALTAIDVAGPMLAGPKYRRICLHSLGVGTMWSGDLLTAQAHLRAALEVSSSDDPVTDNVVRAYLGLCQMLQGQLDLALNTSGSILAEAEQLGWPPMAGISAGCAASAMVHLLREEVGLADWDITNGLASQRAGYERTTDLLLQILRVGLAVSQGRGSAALEMARSARASAGGWQPPPLLNGALNQALTDVALLTANHRSPMDLSLLEPDRHDPIQASCRARLLLAAGDATRARQAAQASISAGAPDTVFDLVALLDAWLVVALAHDLGWAHDPAVMALQTAVEIAGPQQVIRPFLVIRSTRLPILLDQVSPGPHTESLIELIRDRLRTRTHAVGEPGTLDESLTEKELAILIALSTMHTNQEIADTFGISVNTVKTHLKSVFRKLAVDTRRHAAERGRELGLIP